MHNDVTCPKGSMGVVVMLKSKMEPQFNKVAGDRVNLFVKARVHYIENLEVTNLRGNDQSVCYIKV